MPGFSAPIQSYRMQDRATRGTRGIAAAAVVTWKLGTEISLLLSLQTLRELLASVLIDTSPLHQDCWLVLKWWLGSGFGRVEFVCFKCFKSPAPAGSKRFPFVLPPLLHCFIPFLVL